MSNVIGKKGFRSFRPMSAFRIDPQQTCVGSMRLAHSGHLPAGLVLRCGFRIVVTGAKRSLLQDPMPAGWVNLPLHLLFSDFF